MTVNFLMGVLSLIIAALFLCAPGWIRNRIDKNAHPETWSKWSIGRFRFVGVLWALNGIIQFILGLQRYGR